MAKYPRLIAEFLGLNDPQDYTGHCYRVSSATILSNFGVSVLELKQAGNWKSSAVAENYVADSDVAKHNITKRLRFCENNVQLSNVVQSVATSSNSASTGGICYQQVHLHIDWKHARNCSYCLQNRRAPMAQ